MRVQDSLSFDDLAAWYTEEGYKVSPWLELLDLNKWAVGAANPATSGGWRKSAAAVIFEAAVVGWLAGWFGWLVASFCSLFAFFLSPESHIILPC